MKMVFLKISQNSQENTCARVSFLIKLQVSITDLNVNGFQYRFEESCFPDLWDFSSVVSVLKNIKERLVKSLMKLVNGKLLYFRTLCGTSRSEAFTNIRDFEKDLKC